jgi:hypothetical protein
MSSRSAGGRGIDDLANAHDPSAEIISNRWVMCIFDSWNRAVVCHSKKESAPAAGSESRDFLGKIPHLLWQLSLEFHSLALTALSKPRNIFR